MVCEVVFLRERYPSWGGEKLRVLLERKYEKENCPSVRAIERILERSGLTRKRCKRAERSFPSGMLTNPNAPNQVWTADFKGWWKTRDGRTCFPLTIRDQYSRYVLNLSALGGMSYELVKERFESCFQEYGLPEYIRTDNGGPFASIRSVCGLSRLSAWWVTLGITPERILPGKPAMNGAHERMHRDMKQELQLTPEKSLGEQQKRFDAWKEEFNVIRPHQALSQQTPSSIYTKSVLSYDPSEPEFEYPSDVLTRKVDCQGYFHWKHTPLFLSTALRGHRVGIRYEENNTLSLWLCEFLLGKTQLDAFSSPLGGRKGCVSNRLSFD